MLTSIFITYKVKRSKLGLYLAAIRENEDAARSLGVSVVRCSIIALFISAALTAIAGTFYVQYMHYINPDNMALAPAEEVMVLALIGGAGSILGPILASFIFTPISEFARAMLGGTYLGAHLVAYGAAIITVIILIPDGIVGLISKYIREEAGVE
jgi:branched-chain amino acid transport system permease protein